MAQFEKYVKIMSQHAAKLDDVDKELFRLISDGVGHNIGSFDEKQWQEFSPVPAALRWELIWRISPGLADEAFGKNEFRQYSNPFFDPEIVEYKFWQESLSKLNKEIANIEGFTLLSRSFEIETSKEWPDAGSKSNEYKNLLLETGHLTENTIVEVERLQEYLSRIFLRGEQEHVITALKAQVDVILNTIKGSDSMVEIMSYFTDSLLPLFGLAYCRIRFILPKNLTPVLDLLRNTMKHVLEIIKPKFENLEKFNESILSERQFITQRILATLETIKMLYLHLYLPLPSQQPLEGRSEAWDGFVQGLGIRG